MGGGVVLAVTVKAMEGRNMSNTSEAMFYDALLRFICILLPLLC